MAGYVQYFHDIITSINELPSKLMRIVTLINEPIQSLTNTLVVTNILLGLLFLTSLANIYMLWRNGKR
ncbi:hypothetical protein AN963_18925 [Brevibacillus choshinensis]|uniref:Uncharacterized protein n=1 Tax=Brevibacillus choshinensis TaxID=54911 RepID=A0ABR5N8K8_BRECH|nr:hypothetical protein [Brevibacillus choshinensis]KQL46932.1 hypothetical protein AN963_18925 [Brevibacillus choshinensis]